MNDIWYLGRNKQRLGTLFRNNYTKWPQLVS